MGCLGIEKIEARTYTRAYLVHRLTSHKGIITRPLLAHFPDQPLAGDVH